MPRRLTHDHCTSIRVPCKWHCLIEAMAKHEKVSMAEIYRRAVLMLLGIESEAPTNIIHMEAQHES